MKKEKIYRHGEIALRPIEKLPEGLTKSGSKTIIQGSHGNSHTISAGDLYFKDVDIYVFGYLKAKNTKILHLEHGNICSICCFDKLTSGVCPKCHTDFVKENKNREASLPNGIYELRKQQEFISSELEPVID